MIKTFVAMSRADAGFDESRILTLRTYTAGERYAGVPARAAYLEQLVARPRGAAGRSTRRGHELDSHGRRRPADRR
jgi:hypothetical protein